MYILRIALPDRPGELGAVTTALGAAGADIRSMEIVERHDGHAVDDFMVSLPDATMPDELVSACHALDEVRVIWISHTTAGSLITDIDLVEHLLARPAEALTTLVDAVPAGFHASWALVWGPDHRVVAASAQAPTGTETLTDVVDAAQGTAGTVELPAGWLPDWPETTVAVVETPGGHLVVGRNGGPAYLASELARLRHLTAVAQPGADREPPAQP